MGQQRGSTIISALILAITLSAAARVDAQNAVGFGRTVGEAFAQAQMNRAIMDAAAQAGRDLGALRDLKTDLTSKIAAARSAYWQAQYAGRDATKLQAEYLAALWQKDLYFFIIHATNLAREAQNPRGGGAGIGDLIDKLTFTDLDEGIPGFARTEFQAWATEAYRIYATGGLDAGLSASHPNYVIYNKRRNLAEFLFSNPRSPLTAPDSPEEYYADWLLATDSVPSVSAAYTESAAARRFAGAEAFERVVTGLRGNRLGRWKEDFSRSNLRNRQVNWFLQLAVADWQMTRHDPDKYAVYLIKRWSGLGWEQAAALHDARVRRLGRDTVAAAVRDAYAQADDPNGKIVADPYQQQRQTGLLLDPVAEKLGQFTVWEDALDVAVAGMDRAAMQKQMLGYLGGTPGSRTPAERYKDIVSVVDETLLLAALHHKNTTGVLPLVGYRPDPNMAAWPAFAEELRILEGFAAARDDRTYAVRELLGVERGTEFTPLEWAVASYQKRVAAHGEAAVLKAARTTRTAATITHQGITQSGEAFRKLLGEGGTVVNERARAERKSKLDRTDVVLALAYTGGQLKDAVLGHYVNEALVGIRAKAAQTGAKPQSQMNQAYAAAEPRLTAVTERVRSSLARAAAAFERFESSGSSADKREGEAARKIVLDELRLAYDLLRAKDKTDEGATARKYGFASVLDQYIQSRGDVLQSVNDVLALYGATTQP